MVRSTKPKGEIPDQRSHGDRAVGADTDHEFEHLFHLHYRGVLATVMRAGASFHDAEDALMTAIERAWRSRTLIVNLPMWLRTTALRVFINNARRDGERGPRERRASVADNRGTAEAKADPQELKMTQDEVEDVRLTLATLPPTQRTVLALTMDGYSAEEIGSILSMKPATVRSNLRHARSALARLSASAPARNSDDDRGGELNG